MLLKHGFFAPLVMCSLCSALVFGTHEGFISIDCGSSEHHHEDALTKIHYTYDAEYIDTGISATINNLYNISSLSRQFWSTRSFPKGKRNCYNLYPVVDNHRYLIRASFMYGNYDGLNELPEFELYLGVNHWETVKVTNASEEIWTEIISLATADSIAVCLVNTGFSTPFISVLELRSVDHEMYTSVTKSTSLTTFGRWDMGASGGATQIRYDQDPYDRIWKSMNLQSQGFLITSFVIQCVASNGFNPPSIVMQTASQPSHSSNNLEFYWPIDNCESKSSFHFAFHFAELKVLNETETRELNIFINDGQRWNPRPIIPPFLRALTVSTKEAWTLSDGLRVSINKTDMSTLPLILNAFEIYRLKGLSLFTTDNQDVEALMAMKRVYGIKGWNGDPCLPRNYSWDALNCSDSPTPKIISLNLGGSGLSGRISAALEGLKEIQSLNLSNNSLTGTIPDVLSHLPKLVILDLRDNNLSGSVPRALLDKNNSQSLAIRIDGNPSLCSTPSCGQSRDSVQMGRNNHSQCPQAVIIVSIVGGIVIISAFFMLLLWKIRNLQEEVMGSLNDGRHVAVKVLSSASRQGFKEFSAEVKLLMRVHHKNLAAFIGFCEEGNNMILIYEYMAKGNLQGILLDDHSSRVFNWEQRLQIALCAAQGLEYLHYGCKPPIIHRDVKTSNILLNERLEAKLADFGLSKAWANDGDTHISTVVVGTPGYVDPEYYITNKLNEKSDVYSFGIVLLELITGLPAIIVNEQRIHIIQWVTPNLVKGSIASIVDPRMQGQYDTSSMWKVAEIAMACTPHTGIKRPTMSDVVHELKGSLELEVARLKRISGKKSRSQSRNSSNLIQSNSQSVFYPLPR